MIAFLHEEEKLKKLNALEKACLTKLTDTTLMTKILLEGLMYDQVYADLMILVKSNILKKSAISMNTHYFELLLFFESLVNTPELLFRDSHQVFVSESKLYADDEQKINHRLQTGYKQIRNALYNPANVAAKIDEEFLFKLITKVAMAVADKLRGYERDHLPGGRYCEDATDVSVKNILSSLVPNNDITESVFGMNDWLTTVIPNMAQATRTALIEFSYNKTMQWLKDQGEAQKSTLIALAQTRRKMVIERLKAEKDAMLNKKIQARTEAIKLANQKKAKEIELVNRLLPEQVIETVHELKQKVAGIQALSIPTSVQSAEIKALVKKQIQIRSLVFKQAVSITFSSQGNLKEGSQLIQELSKIITKHPISKDCSECRSPTNLSHQGLNVIFDKPTLLVGVKIKHKFNIDGIDQWFIGLIKGYRKGRFQIMYDPDENCEFTIEEVKEDYINGDFWIV